MSTPNTNWIVAISATATILQSIKKNPNDEQITWVNSILFSIIIFYAQIYTNTQTATADG